MNISEGRDPAELAILTAAAGTDLLDVHSDPYHNRTVLTLVGEDAPRAVARVAVERLDLRAHHGVHPRVGVVDVVPFVPLGSATLDDARRARDDFAHWIADELDVPAFVYGPERALPDIRRHAFSRLAPDHGPATPHPTAGAVAVGARPLLVAWNVWLVTPDLARARQVAAAIRGPQVRALGLAVGGGAQVSTNLVAPEVVGPAEAWDLVAGLEPVSRSELVGLVPRAVLTRTPRSRWEQLDLSADRTIEARLGR